MIMFNNKVIFITWWTWTWWQAITKALLKSYDVKKIIVFSRSEYNQVKMENLFSDSRLQFILGDTRNLDLLKKVTTWVDFIIHLASLKHISKCEYNNSEAISINIWWTQNIIDAAIYNNVKKVLNISTDKAVDPYNLYWNTKAISEKIISSANNYLSNKGTIFYNIRAWNILWSNGSVLEIFHNQIVNKKPITITDLEMKRFYNTIEEIVELISYSFEKSKWWEIYVLKWRVLSLKEILNIMLDIYWNRKEEIIYLWAKKWEKINETLISINEASTTFVANDKYYLIDSLWNYSDIFDKVDFDTYSTNNQLQSKLDDIKEYIKGLKFN